jgi:hypothetical protein
MLRTLVDLTFFAILTIIAFCCITALSRATDLHPLVVVGVPEKDVALECPVPEYPGAALRLHISGDVLVTVGVHHGNATSATASSHSSILAESARRWVEFRWTFKPSASGVFTIPISYRERV